MIYCAREFSVQDIQTINDLMAQNPKLKRAALSRKLCELFAWAKPNGEIQKVSEVGTHFADVNVTKCVLGAYRSAKFGRLGRDHSFVYPMQLEAIRRR